MIDYSFFKDNKIIESNPFAVKFKRIDDVRYKLIKMAFKNNVLDIESDDVDYYDFKTDNTALFYDNILVPDYDRMEMHRIYYIELKKEGMFYDSTSYYEIYLIYAYYYHCTDNEKKIYYYILLKNKNKYECFKINYERMKELINLVNGKSQFVLL